MGIGLSRSRNISKSIGKRIANIFLRKYRYRR